MRVTTCLLLALATPLAAAEGNSFQLKGDWWRQPAAPGRHVTLACSFDSADSNDADYARGDHRASGFGMKADAAGRHGRGVQIAETGGHLSFAGGSNAPIRSGTARVWVRGAVWQDKTPRWLWEARAADRIGVRRETGKLSLLFMRGRSDTSELARLDLPVGEVSPDEWHCVVASWDRNAGRGWIALDGRGVSGPMTFSSDPRPAFVLYVGGGFGSRLGGLNLPGLSLDDFTLYDAPLPLLERSPGEIPGEDAEFLPQAEAAARKTLNFIADLQRWGGWQTLYTWPTLIGSSAQGREWVDFDDYLDNDKGNGSPRVAANFLYAYEVLGDMRFLDVALRTGEFLLAAQDERGFWSYGYRMTVHGVRPVGSERHIKFQDEDQAHPMLFLAALHRLTGDERYLEAVKRAGEFYLQAQNPNGSWSHHFDAVDGVGKNAIGQPHGGELNDRAMNDAIDIMAFLYHVTGDKKYVAAMRRAGDWLLEAQGDATPLWADQYDSANRPAFARHFEPPSYGVTATKSACEALREMYRFSGDDRYLQGIRRAVAWMERELPDGKMPYYVDPKSGRPVASWERKIYFLDDPKQLAYLKTVPTGHWYLERIEITNYTRRLLARAKPPQPVQLSVATTRASLPAYRKGARSAIDTANEAGVWVVPNVAQFMGSLGAGFAAITPRVLLILRYIDRARIALGELAPVYRGDGNMRRMAYPQDDWYEVDWSANGN